VQDSPIPGYLHAFDPNTGAPIWTSSVAVTQPGWSCTDPIIAAGSLIQVGTFDGTLLSFDIHTGQLVWKRRTSSGLRLHWRVDGGALR
jgi:outer membrane protein assembly factor BamB